MIWCNCTVGKKISAFSCNVLTEFQEIIPYAHHKQICAVYPKVHNPWCSICCAFPSETLRCATVRPCITHFGIIKYPQCCISFICVSYLVCVNRSLCFLNLRGLSTENPDLVQLKSLLAGLTLPVKFGSSESAAEDRDGRSSNTSPHKRQSYMWGARLSLFVFQLRIRPPAAPSLWSTSHLPCRWLRLTWLNAWRRSPKEKQLRVREKTAS